jgi:hypothetical protein
MENLFSSITKAQQIRGKSDAISADVCRAGCQMSVHGHLEFEVRSLRATHFHSGLRPETPANSS